jgi:hypothetical protein
MWKSLLVATILLLSGGIASAQDKPSARIVIQGSPTQIKKQAVAMFARGGFSLDSETASQVKISKPFSEEETAAYNTAHWTNEPVANCRHLYIFSLAPADEAVTVTVENQMVCTTNSKWMFLRIADEKENEQMQSSLNTLKAKIEERKSN